MRFRIAGKIWLSLSVLVAAYVLTTVVVFLNGLRAERSLDTLGGVTLHTAQLSQTALATFDNLTQTFETVVRTGSVSLLESAKESARRAEDSLLAIGHLGGASAVKALETAEELKAYAKAGDEVCRALASGTGGSGASVRAEQLVRRSQGLRQRLAALASASSAGLQSDIGRLAAESRVRRHFLAVLAFGVLSLSIAAVGWVTRRCITRPVADMAGSLRTFAAGRTDLEKRLQLKSQDEVGELASGFRQFVGGLGTMVERLKSVSANFLDVADQIGSSSREVAGGAVDQARLLASSSAAVKSIRESIDGIAASTVELFEASVRSSSASYEMSVTNESIAGQMEQLFTHVDGVSVSVDELSAAIQQIAAFICEVEASATHTAEAVASLDSRVASIRASADAASRFSEEAAKDAEIGKRAVDLTIAGVAALQSIAERSGEVIADLGTRTVAIGGFLSVIDELAEQTNLLALNAAILAAQAGEQGRGFAVVADEIRDLAERTGASTQEIASIIEGLQRAAQDAVTTMSAGRERVLREAELAREAGAALEKIHAGAFESLALSRRIALETQEQANGSREAKLAVEQIASMIKEATLGASQQRDSAEVASHNARAMKDIAEAVKNGTAEQALASSEIAEHLDRIRLMTERINASTQEQAARTGELLEASYQTLQIAETTAEKAAHMERVTDTLIRESTALAEEMRSFTI